MRIVKYLFSNTKFYIQTIITTLLFVISSTFFIERINTVHTINQTLNNTSCRFVAYDSWEEDNNTYQYYDNKVDVYLSDPNSLLNVVVAQFIEGNTYNNYSYLNSKNVVDGQYLDLNENEIALPIFYKNKQHLSVGSNIYVSGKKCVIKYFHKDFYQVVEMKPTYPVQIMFVGKNTIGDEPVSYLKFNPDDYSHHDKLYSINNTLRRDYRNSEGSLTTLLSIIYFVIVLIVIDYFRGKNMKNMLVKSIINGESHLILKASFICLLFVLFPSLLLAIATIWNPLVTVLPYMLSVLGIHLILSVVAYLIFIERRKRSWKA